MLNAAEILSTGQTGEVKDAGKGARKQEGASPETAASAFMEFFSGTMARSVAAGSVDEGSLAPAPAERASNREVNKAPEVEAPSEKERNTETIKSVRTDKPAEDDTKRAEGDDALRQRREGEAEADLSAREAGRQRRAGRAEAADNRKVEKAAVQAAGKGLAKLQAEGKAVAAETAEAAKDVKDIAAQTAAKQSARTATAQADTATVNAPARKAAEAEAVSFKDEMPKVAVNKTAVSAETQKAPTTEQANTNQHQGQGDGGRSETATQNTDLAAAANSTAKAASANKSFSAFLDGAKTGKQSTATRVNGPHVSMNIASSQYTRAATDVINTGKTKAAAPAPPAQVLSQIIRAAKVSLQAGKEEMKMLLKPEDLGWLKVKINIEGQKVTAHFSAENEFVRGLLENNISHLQQALQGQNLKVSQIVIDVNTQMQQDAGAAKDQQHGSRQKQSKSDVDPELLEDMVLVPDMQSVRMTALDYCV